MGPVGGRRFGGSVKFADGKNAKRRGQISCLTWSLPNSQLKNQHQILWCGYQHVITSRAYNSTSIHAASSVFLLRCECSGTDKTRRKKRASLVWIGPKGLFTPKTHVFSAADILLRIYQNPMHLNGTRWRTTFWRQREVRRRKKR